MIPAFIPNYGIPLFNVKFHIYLITSIIIYIPYGALVIYIGK